MKQNLITLLLASLSLSACAENSSNIQKHNTPHSPELQTKINKLLDKTKKNLIFVEGGSFMMGDFDHYDSNIDSKPLHKVTLDSFSMSAYKTTYEDMDVYSEATNTPKVVSTESYSSEIRYPTFSAGVSWEEGRNYCQWLGKQLNLKKDLPTEAQWEYAARNRGTNVHYPTNIGEIEDGINVWSFDQREQLQTKYVTAFRNISDLGKFPPNPLGFYDMISDNYEWMLDWYSADYYRNSPEKNPQGPRTGTTKVLRSAEPSSGKSLKMGAGLTVRRNHAHPIQDPEFLKEFKGVINPNFNHSVRCVVNQTTPIK